MAISDAKKRKLGDKYDPEKLFLEGYDYSLWSENKEESTDKKESVYLSDMPPLEGDEEVKEGRIKIFNSKQIINETSNTISTNKNWKQFIQIKK